ncbi:MAG TPA: phosphopantetheine-binding protein, partial [Thermoanaerobaculia bacterium]|nr:phosphopantetheine-binding protein [Thermoanaerobaculia bacterium]
GVREVVVMAREDRPGDLRLVAYLVPRPDAAPRPRLTIELRSLVREHLPEPMVPAAWVVLEALPLSATGKVDRKALPAPERTSIEAATDYVPPRSPLESLLAGICAQVLGVSQVGINDNFFDLGGNSILATQVVSTVQELLPVELPLRNVFETPTVGQLGDLLERSFLGMGEEDRAVVDRMLAEFELLTAEEPAEAIAQGEAT